VKSVVGLLVAVTALVLAVPLVGLAVPDTVRIPKAKPHPPGTPEAEALFSHWSHGSYRCFSCHPGLFPQAPLGFTHADMNRGKFCGHCHQASGQAPAVQSYSCDRCHVSR
jgi:c(7)-type cytochrome triheme protein